MHAQAAKARQAETAAAADDDSDEEESSEEEDSDEEDEKPAAKKAAPAAKKVGCYFIMGRASLCRCRAVCRCELMLLRWCFAVSSAAV